MIKNNKILLITKSYKDICTFEKLIKDTLPITVDAPTSENFLLTKDMYINLWCNYTDFYSLMDFDFTGRALAFKMKRLYGIKPLFFTNGKRGTKYDFKVKDLTDYVKKYGHRAESAKNNNGIDFKAIATQIDLEFGTSGQTQARIDFE